MVIFMDKLKTIGLIIVATILLSVALDFASRSFDRYCDLKLFERESKVGSSCLTNRTSPLVEIVQTGVKPGEIVEENL